MSCSSIEDTRMLVERFSARDRGEAAARIRRIAELAVQPDPGQDPTSFTVGIIPGRAMGHKCPTLMIAEPGSNLSTALVPWLADQGYEVKVVDNLKDALMTLQNEKIHVLVMDACLAQGMGYETIAIIKGLCRHLPIIITTEENNPEQESTIRQKGIFYYHVKSFGMDELILAISNAMARSVA